MIPSLARVFVEKLSHESASKSVCEELQLDDIKLIDNDFINLVSHYGSKKVAQLIIFAYDWKYKSWREIRKNKQRQPDFDLCRDAFRIQLPKLYRGVVLTHNASILKKKIGLPFEIKLSKHSISSWTSKIGVAERFAYNGFEYGSLDPATHDAIVLCMKNKGDSVILAVPANSKKYCPDWYRKLYYAYTKQKPRQESNESEFEFIISLSDITVEIVSRANAGENDSDVIEPDISKLNKQKQSVKVV